jgi:hypothetical protein
MGMLKHLQEKAFIAIKSLTIPVNKGEPKNKLATNKVAVTNENS